MDPACLDASKKMTTLALEFRDVSYRYPRVDRWVLSDINLKVRKNCFLILAGPTGSGKSTLLKVARGLHKEYGGEFQGKIYIWGEDIGDLRASDLGSRLAIIFQSPAYQLHQPRVIDEIMSAPIYQGLPWQECLERAQQSAEEILDGGFLGRNPIDLSTGEQQKVALAASLAMRAEILLLDEPFSYLDAKAADDFLQVVKALKEKGKTIILATHNLEPVASLADRIALIAEGRLVMEGTPRDVLYSSELNHTLGRPLFVEVGYRLLKGGQLAKHVVSWQEVAKSVRTDKGVRIGQVSSPEAAKQPKQLAINISRVSYVYPNGNIGVKDLSLDVERGEILGIVGGNGSGKTTLARLILGLLKPSGGTVRIFVEELKHMASTIASKVGYVTQDPGDMLFETTVFKECSFGPISLGTQEAHTKVEAVLSGLGLLKYADSDPRSLSAGEQRLLTLADVLVNDPEILILDEPEFGLDPKTWESVLSVIRDLRDEGKTIVFITQNLEATMLLCDRIVLMKEGKLLATGRPMEIYGDRQLLERAGLRYLPFFCVFEFVVGRTEEPVSQRAFADALVSLWPVSERQ